MVIIQQLHAINSMLAAKYHPETVTLVSLCVAGLTLKQEHWLLKKRKK